MGWFLGGWFVEWLFVMLVGGLVGWWVGHSVSSLAAKLVGWFFVCLVGWLVVWLVFGRFVGWLVNGLIVFWFGGSVTWWDSELLRW